MSTKKLMNSVCCIFNVAPHYNTSIYKKLDTKIGCDFYIGDKIATPLKLMDYKVLLGFRKLLKNITLFGNFYWQVGALSALFKPYKKYVLTGEPYCLSTWVIIIVCKLTRKETYLWSHGWYGKESRLKKNIKKVFFRLSTKIFLYGNYARDLMIKEGFNPDDLIVIYNSLNDDELYEQRPFIAETNIYNNYFNNRDPIILYVGRIQRLKKIELLLEAIHLLNKNNKPFNLILIGREVESIGLLDQISNFDLKSRVWIYGESYDEYELSNLIHNANVCVSPGNVGLTAVHAMFYGLPVITHDNFPNQMPEYEAIVPGVTGDFFQEGSAHDLAKTIDSWVSANKDKIKVDRACYHIVDTYYNSNKQIEIFKLYLN